MKFNISLAISQRSMKNIIEHATERSNIDFSKFS